MPAGTGPRRLAEMAPSPMHHHNNADWQLSLKSVHIYLSIKKL
jgi:hypothetical protein